MDKLFRKLDAWLDKEGVIMHEGKISDTTIVETPGQRNTREENEQMPSTGRVERNPQQTAPTICSATHNSRCAYQGRSGSNRS